MLIAGIIFRIGLNSMKMWGIMVRLSYILTFALCMSMPAAWAKGEGTSDLSIKQDAVQTSKQSQVYTYQLDNGLRLWVKPDHRAPTATHMVWYRVGSRDEVDGASGLAHMLEHMMFRGSASIPNGDFSRKVAQLGGYDNAFTSNDMTAYFEQIPVQALPEVMRMEADRMTGLTLNDEDFLKELEVVKEERRMRTDEQPRAQLWERLMAAAYMADPYHRPVVGWMSDLDAMTIDDVRSFYQHWYRPDNAAVVIVGDVKPEDALKMAQATYGQIPAAKTALVPSKPRVEPEQRGIRRIEHKAPASQDYVMLAYKVPALTQLAQDDAQAQDAYALTLLAAVLDGTSSSRLQRHLVQGQDGQRIADSAGAGYGLTARGPVMFILSGVPAQGHTPEELEAALRLEIQRIAKDGVDAQELQRIKTQWVASQVFAKDSSMAQAQDLGSNWILQMSPDATDILIEKLRQVTPEQVQDVAKRYFSDEQLTVGVLRAQPLSEGERVPEDEGSSTLMH